VQTLRSFSGGTNKKNGKLGARGMPKGKVGTGRKTPAGSGSIVGRKKRFQEGWRLAMMCSGKSGGRGGE